MLNGIKALVVPFLFLACNAYTMDCKLPSEQCSRIERMASKWKSRSFSSMTIVAAGDATPFAAVGGEKSPEADASAAQVKEQERHIGSCWYDENESQIAVQRDAYAFTDVGFEQCVSAAFAQSRYDDVEAKWLAHLGEHEAWVIQGGVLTKVSVGEKKVETAAARALWESFATRELFAQCHTEETSGDAQANRAVASGQTGDSEVRSLLGME